jgi:hypothetical protein
MTPEAFIQACKDRKIEILECEGSYIRILKRFAPGDQAAYVAAETDCSILYETPSVGAGSYWGTTSDGVGGYVGCKNGYYELKKSNLAKRFSKKVKDLLRTSICSR